MQVLQDGLPVTDITPGSEDPYTPGFALVPAPAAAPRASLAGPWLQFMADGAALGGPDIAVVDIVIDASLVTVTRGVGENSHVITIKKPDPLPIPQLGWLAYWNATEVDTSGGNVRIVDDSGNGIHVETSQSVPPIIVAAPGVNGDCVFLPAYFNPHFFSQSLNTKTLDPRLNFGNEPFSIGRWVKLEAPFQSDTTGRLLLGRWQTGNGGQYDEASYMLYYKRSTNEFSWGMSSDGANGTGISRVMTAGDELNWHFLVGAYDGTTMHLWVDAGVPVTALHAGGAFAGSEAYFSFDYRFGNNSFGDNDSSAKVTVNSYFMSGFVLPRMITQEEVEFLFDNGRLMFDETQLL